MFCDACSCFLCLREIFGKSTVCFEGRFFARLSSKKINTVKSNRRKPYEHVMFQQEMNNSNGACFISGCYFLAEKCSANLFLASNITRWTGEDAKIPRKEKSQGLGWVILTGWEVDSKSIHGSCTIS